MKGMISNFSEMDESDPLNSFLMKGDISGLNEPLNRLQKKRLYLRGSERSQLKLLHTGETILTYSQRKKLRAVADFVYGLQKMQGKGDATLQDVKIILPCGVISKITGSETAESVLKGHHIRSIDSSKQKLVLRRTCPTNACLPWHVDGLYSESVVQYTLNDDTSYKGGRLCFFTDDTGLHVPKRPAGTLTVHTREMHAVSRLLSGVRYVLFVVDGTNYLGGDTENIVVLRQDLLDKMHTSMSLLNNEEDLTDNDEDNYDDSHDDDEVDGDYESSMSL